MAMDPDVARFVDRLLSTKREYCELRRSEYDELRRQCGVGDNHFSLVLWGRKMADSGLEDCQRRIRCDSGRVYVWCFKCEHRQVATPPTPPKPARRSGEKRGHVTTGTTPHDRKRDPRSRSGVTPKLIDFDDGQFGTRLCDQSSRTTRRLSFRISVPTRGCRTQTSPLPCGSSHSSTTIVI